MIREEIHDPVLLGVKSAGRQKRLAGGAGFVGRANCQQGFLHGYGG